MIKLNKFAFMGAIALGAVGFTACSSDDLADGSKVNPTFDGESVKTQFAINVPAGNLKTRLADDIVQADGKTFRGMTNIQLVPFKLTGSAPLSVSTATVLTDVNPIALANIGGNDLQEGGNYKVYYDVDVETGVNYFLFYGEAAGTLTDYKNNGSLRPSYDMSGWPHTTLADVKFDLRSILGDNTVSEAQKTLADMLTDIAGTTAGTDPDTHAWAAEIGNDLANYYSNFTDLKAGSANSIKAAIADLYASMKSDKVADNNGLKAAIAAKIDEYFTAGDADGSGEYPDFAFKAGTAESVSTFPANLGLPDGSMQLTFAEGKFSYVNPSQDGDPNLMEQTAYANYAYPASLYYTTATPIKTANTPQTTDGVYNGNKTSWNDIINDLYGTGGTTVDASTQSIALVNQINYAVASLEMNIHFADQAILDNGGTYKPEGASAVVGEITVPINEEGFDLTGVLVGDQKRVGYDFKAISDDSDATTWTVYDASTDGAKVKKSHDNPAKPTAYTLVLQTAGKQGTTGENVRFALEMKNTSGIAFCGKDGIVPAGGTFYLFGEISTKDQTETNYVFEQDHKTVANVTINSLKSAYNCIPDMRSPKLELGLSVDLTWEQGLVDNVTIE